MKIDAEKIEAVIENFQNGQDFNLATLMEDARFLAGQLYPFAKGIGDYQRRYNEFHVQRKTKHAQLIMQVRDARKVSVAEAERIADQDPEYIELYRLEYENEARYEKGRLMFRAIEQTINRMNQEIAEMRGERDRYPKPHLVPVNEL